MRRYGRQGLLTSRLDRIAESPLVAERVRPQMHRLAARLSAADRARIVKDRRDGAKLPWLMMKYSLSSYSLRLVFAEGGIAPSKASLSSKQLEQIQQLATTDYSVLAIATLVDALQSSVRLIVAYLRANCSCTY